MNKMFIDVKDDKFLVSITPSFENTFVVDVIEITEEAKNAIDNKEGSESPVKEFISHWRETLFKPEEKL